MCQKREMWCTNTDTHYLVQMSTVNIGSLSVIVTKGTLLFTACLSPPHWLRSYQTRGRGYYFSPIFQICETHIEYHADISQVSKQLICGDTSQIWMWFKASKRYFCNIENFAYWLTKGTLIPPPQSQKQVICTRTNNTFIWTSYMSKCLVVPTSHISSHQIWHPWHTTFSHH